MSTKEYILGDPRQVAAKQAEIDEREKKEKAEIEKAVKEKEKIEKEISMEKNK